MADMQFTITQIWSSILEIKDIDPKDDFFKIGGNSIQILKILHGIKEEFGIELNLENFVDSPTIEGLVTMLTENDVS